MATVDPETRRYLNGILRSTSGVAPGSVDEITHANACVDLIQDHPDLVAYVTGISPQFGLVSEHPDRPINVLVGGFSGPYEGPHDTRSAIALADTLRRSAPDDITVVPVVAGPGSNPVQFAHHHLLGKDPFSEPDDSSCVLVQTASQENQLLLAIGDLANHPNRREMLQALVLSPRSHDGMTGNMADPGGRVAIASVEIDGGAEFWSTVRAAAEAGDKVRRAERQARAERPRSPFQEMRLEPELSDRVVLLGSHGDRSTGITDAMLVGRCNANAIHVLTDMDHEPDHRAIRRGEIAYVHFSAKPKPGFLNQITALARTINPTNTQVIGEGGPKGAEPAKRTAISPAGATEPAPDRSTRTKR